MEVLILGVYLEIFLFRIKWSKIRVRIIHGRALYTGKYGSYLCNSSFHTKKQTKPSKRQKCCYLLALGNDHEQFCYNKFMS